MMEEQAPFEATNTMDDLLARKHDAIQRMLPTFPNQPDPRTDFGLMITAYGVDHVITFCHRRAADHDAHARWYRNMADHLMFGAPDPRVSAGA
jgi:hypothetical protein